MRVSDMMTSPVQTMSPEMSIAQAARIMRDFSIGAVPVKDKGKILGMVTDRDIAVRAVVYQLDPQMTPVGEIMTPDVTCCFETTSIQQAAGMMEERKIHRLLVLGSSNRITGILSIGDIARKSQDEHLLRGVLNKVCEPAGVY